MLLAGSLLRRVRVLGLKPSDAHHFAQYLANLPPRVDPQRVSNLIQIGLGFRVTNFQQWHRRKNKRHALRRPPRVDTTQ